MMSAREPRAYRRPLVGALAPGVTADTVDAISLEKTERLITALRYERSQRLSGASRTVADGCGVRHF